MGTDLRRRKRITVLALLGVIGVMVGLDVAAVPLYRLFCAVTGYGGTTQRAASAPGSEGGRLITVRFNALTADDLGWRFEPEVLSVQIRPGEDKRIAYRAVNETREPVIGTATYNVTPAKAGVYFDKINCFCFTRQRLSPGENADLWVSFFVDPDILTDPNTRDVDTITLSYTMFRAKNQDDPAAVDSGASQSPVSVAHAQDQAAKKPQ